MKLVALGLLASLFCTRVATAETVRDEHDGFSFELPEGYQRLPPLPSPAHFAFVLKRGEVSVGDYALISVESSGATPELPGAEQRSVTWQGRALESFVVREAKGGVETSTFVTQVPLSRGMLDVRTAGPRAFEARLEREHAALISTVRVEQPGLAWAPWALAAVGVLVSVLLLGRQAKSRISA